MKLATIKRRLAKERPMISVTLRMPADVVEDMKRIAPRKGYAGYQALMRAYVGAGLREDLERHEGVDLHELVARLKEQGVPSDAITRALKRTA